MSAGQAASAAGGTENGAAVEMTHPFPHGSQVLARYRDRVNQTTKLLPAQVIEFRKDTSRSTPEETRWLYYVHYLEFNRRMDSWVPQDGVEVDPEPERQDQELLEVIEEEVDDKGIVTRATRKRRAEDVLHTVEPGHDEHAGMDAASIREHEEVTKVKNINFIELGKHRIETWYFSPYPKEYYPEGVIDTLYIHEFSLRFFRHKSELLRHARKYPLRHPPGDEIYRKDNIAVFEVDGAKEKEYCQNLCYLAKLFLDHKTLYWDVDPFLFYIVTEVDEYGYHIVGYFSKEKQSEEGYNLACILTLPCYQRRGFGRFIIQFSYELSKKEGRVGSPEKPLSDLGLLSYRSYWSWVLLGILRENSVGEDISIMDLTRDTSIKHEDVISTLEHHGLIRYVSGQPVICADPKLIEDKFQRLNSKKGPLVDSSAVHWAPMNVHSKREKDKWLIKSKMRRSEDA